ncbi:phosphatase PAP2 family protein [Shewanella olleyana]|uniref:phosphatase PAP2 family protein n=1 Tax=Shewanella olleyana TaxID=135626 RepID=UPI00200BB90D|nr:phosphatase PAP2 family protein [Shewanella olleyana]MCL1068135.1 phosphatase PAP2 family protein [Shewanella olleyana]
MALLSIAFFDRSIAEFMHLHSQSNFLFEGFSKIPLLLEILAAAIVLLSFHKRYQTKLFHIRRIIILVAIVASSIRVGAKIIFGRTWPETWTNNNLSWISDGVESFHFFSLSNSFHSFPSGHALLTFAFASLFWRFAPQYRLVWIFCMIAVIAGQLGQNYHYLGDLLAGGLIGALVTQLTINRYITFYQTQKKAQ